MLCWTRLSTCLHLVTRPDGPVRCGGSFFPFLSLLSLVSLLSLISLQSLISPFSFRFSLLFISFFLPCFLYYSLCLSSFISSHSFFPPSSTIFLFIFFVLFSSCVFVLFESTLVSFLLLRPSILSSSSSSFLSAASEVN